ncbi:ankyrin repeat-containing domain protein [Vararia minispora EC-137]|uniref:Ankyrin repeat-containing domain protein n=1 Tax=Vararia minispora EC-137 TaxID=1314806 RepID=A0ACB8QV72_9AGAM|nr:ankyrin repeat-containing domain protein [Vararia minispora EC-137]
MIPYPHDLGDWGRQKDGLFKARMAMDDDMFKRLQNSEKPAPQVVASIKTERQDKIRRQRCKLQATAQKQHPPPICHSYFIFSTSQLDKESSESSRDAHSGSRPISSPRRPASVQLESRIILETSARTKISLADSLVIAAREGYLNVVQSPVAIGLDVNHHASSSSIHPGLSALLAAIRGNHDPIIEYLLQLEPLPILDPIVLTNASYHGRHRVVRACVEGGVDPNGHNKDGLTPLLAAVRKENHGIATYLRDKGAMHSADDLVAAAGFGDLHIVKDIVQAGADVNAPARHHEVFSGMTPPHAALSNAHRPTVEFFLRQASARCNTPSDLVIASFSGFADVVSLALKNGVNVNTTAECRGPLLGEHGEFTPL